MVPAWLLVTDVDGTLIGNPAALERLLQRIQSTPLGLVLNSSRPIDSLKADPEFNDLNAQGLIGALGTEIELNGERIRAWHLELNRFPRIAITETLARFGPPHPDEFQSDAKVGHAVPKAHQEEATRAVQFLGDDLRVITSGESNFDVIPANAGKTAAARHVATRLQIPWDRVVTAGDSEIDAGMLVAAKGIAVGNATSELRDKVADHAYMATATHAGGILEGLAYYGAGL